MKKIFIGTMILVLAASLVIVYRHAQAGGEPQEKIEIRVVTAWTEKAAEHYGFWLFIDELEKRLGDRLEINYLGGAEVIPYFEQYEMLGKGMYELGHLPGNLAKNFLAIADTLHLHHLSPMELRETGAYDILAKAFEDDMNIFYLGTTAGRGWGYVLYTNFDVNSLDDFKGKTFRVAPVYVPLLKALGAGSVAMPPGEVYTAMQRGVVDGFGWTTLGPLDFGWPEVTKYLILPSFYQVDVNVYFNKDAFDNLPRDIQREIKDIMIEMEKVVWEKAGELVDKEIKGMLEQGMKIINLAPADAERYQQIALDEAWKEVLEADPERGKKLRELMK